MQHCNNTSQLSRVDREIPRPDLLAPTFAVGELKEVPVPVMAVVRRLVRPSVGALRLAGAVAAVPISITAAVLDSPRAARSDPASQLLDELRGQGWRPIEVRLERRRTEVRLERGAQQHTMTGETLAFAAYATLAGARADALVHHTA
jgi:hypothetical protein